MKWYPWLNLPYLKIITLYQQSKGHHAFLLHSQAGIGGSALYYAISRWLMCSNPKGIKSCGVCHCCQLMIAKNHPDFYHLAPDNELKILKISDINVVFDSIYNCAHQDRIKIVSIPYIDNLTEQVTNKLLKILEEPPANTYFLLRCRELLHLSMTLKSRCLCWKLLIPKKNLSISWLQQVGNYNLDIVRIAINLCGGLPLAAKKLLHPIYWQERLHLCKTLSYSIANNDLLSLLPLINCKNNKSINWLLTFLSDAVKYQQNAKEFIINYDNLKLIEMIATYWTTKALHAQWHKWLYYLFICQKIDNINHELLITNQLLDWEQSSSYNRDHEIIRL